MGGVSQHPQGCRHPPPPTEADTPPKQTATAADGTSYWTDCQFESFHHCLTVRIWRSSCAWLWTTRRGLRWRLIDTETS